jgi:hypothetical protein
MQENMTPVEFKIGELDGKRIAYHDKTHFLVQIGRGKGGYKTKYRIIGSLSQAVWYYRAVNIGKGFKKRLYAPTLNNPTLARATS